MATVPLPHAAIVGDFVMVDTLDLPKDKYIYDESYRLVTKKPFFCVMRVAAVARFLHENALKVGVLGEYHGFNTGRDSGVFRLGPIGMLQVTDHLQIAAGVTLMVTSPDHLGLALGAYGVFWIFCVTSGRPERDAPSGRGREKSFRCSEHVPSEQLQLNMGRGRVESFSGQLQADVGLRSACFLAEIDRHPPDAAACCDTHVEVPHGHRRCTRIDDIRLRATPATVERLKKVPHGRLVLPTALGVQHVDLQR